LTRKVLVDVALSRYSRRPTGRRDSARLSAVSYQARPGRRQHAPRCGGRRDDVCGSRTYKQGGSRAEAKSPFWVESSRVE